jgi:hypothetical protein
LPLDSLSRHPFLPPGSASNLALGSLLSLKHHSKDCTRGTC